MTFLPTINDDTLPSDVLFPNLGFDEKANLKRLYAIRDILQIAASIWSGGPGMTRTGNLRSSIALYAGGWRCASDEKVDTVHAYIESFAPEGGDTYMRDMSMGEYRALMEAVSAQAQRHETLLAYRAQQQPMFLPMAAE